MGNIRICLWFYTIVNYQYLKFSVAQIISCFKIESFVPALYFLLLHITKSHGNRCSNLFLRWPKVRLASLDFRRLKSGQQYLKTQMCLSENLTYINIIYILNSQLSLNVALTNICLDNPWYDRLIWICWGGLEPYSRLNLIYLQLEIRTLLMSNNYYVYNL